MTRRVVKKLMLFATPFYGNPEYWAEIKGMNVVFNVKPIAGKYWCEDHIIIVNSRQPKIFGENPEDAVYNFLINRKHNVNR